MPFEISWDPNAIKDLDKFPKEIKQRILNKVDESEADPLRFAERIVDVGGYKIRVGDYRIFVSISYNPDKVRIMAIRHRRNAYQRMPF